MGTKSEKDVRVELLRCAACFMVILTHIRIPDMVNGQILKSGVLVECLSAVCVGMFFLATGFFLYDGKRTVWQTVRHFAEKTLLPTVLVVCATLLLDNWLMSETSFLHCLKSADIPEILLTTGKGLFQMSSDYWGLHCGHLWYITEYMKLMLFVPAMMILVKYAGDRILLYLAALNLLLCIDIDLTTLYGMMYFFPYTEPFLRPSQMLLLVGFLLYHNREKLEEKKQTRLFLLAAYGASVLWMFYAQMKQLTMQGEAGVAYFTTWTSGTGMISTILLTALVLSLPAGHAVWKHIRKPLLFLGKLSFPVYLLHYGVIIKLETLGVASGFRELTALHKGIFIYYAAYGLVIFAVTSLLVLLIGAGKTAVCRLIKSLKSAVKRF